MHQRAGIVVQARMASARLPGKALALVGDRSILEQCLRRLMASGAAQVVLATTTLREDDALVATAVRLGVPEFRGDSADVLERFVRCAAQFQLELVVRATADNPGVDIQAPVRVLAALRRSGAAYVREEGLPHGAGVEGVAAEALTRAATLSRDAFDREHVTTFIRRRNDLFRAVDLAAPADIARPDVRLTVDTWNDLQHVRELYVSAGREMPSLADLIAASDRAACRSVA